MNQTPTHGSGISKISKAATLIKGGKIKHAHNH